MDLCAIIVDDNRKESLARRQNDQRPMKRERLIRRYEHNHFSGWVVSTKRRGRRWAKYFSDKPHGRTAALRRAREYRHWLLEQLPKATKVKRRYVRNTTGEIGVALAEGAHASRNAPVAIRRAMAYLRRSPCEGELLGGVLRSRRGSPTCN